MKAVPYMETVGSNEYKTFMMQAFEPKKIPEYFKGWINSDRSQYDKPNKKLFDRVKFYIEYYTINSNEYRLPYPATLNDFISDLNRAKIDLEWSDEIVKMWSVHELIKQSELKEYYNGLLRNLDKLNELL